jgi:hypothetical protein
MNTQEALVFRLKKQEQEIMIDDVQYVLSELDGMERDSYLNDIGNRMHVGTDKKSTVVKNFSGMQAFLVSLSLRVVETGKNVPVETIQKWPARVIKKLHDLAVEFSALGEGGKKDEIKNV